MTFTQWIKGFKTSLDSVTEIGMSDAIRLYTDETGLCLDLDHKKVDTLSETAYKVLRLYDDEPFIERLELYLTAYNLGKGPKVFRPTTAQMLALEQMTLNIGVEDFHMPFKAITIELPDDYGKMRMMEDGQPSICLLYHDEQYGILMHSLSTEDMSTKGWWRPGMGDMLEDWFKGEQHAETVEQKIRRAALNYCLLLDEVGIKADGPAVPNEYAQLVKWTQKRNEHTARNKLNLQRHPTIYRLAGETVLVRQVGSADSESKDESGRVMAPHNRRGHYRMQVCGPKRSERKCIRIPAVMVNAHLMNGPNTQTYRS